MKKIFYMCFSLILFLLLNREFFSIKDEKEPQVGSYHAKVVILEEIKEESDYFGRRVFSGKVKNNGKRRADFVQITFTMYNKKEKEIGKKEIFISGSQYVFGDSTISTSTLKMSEVGTFRCYTTVLSDSIAKYVYKIKWKEHKYD